MNGGLLVRATCHTPTRYISGNMASARTNDSLPSFIWMSRRPAATSWVCATNTSIHNVNSKPWAMTDGGSDGFGRGTVT